MSVTPVTTPSAAPIDTDRATDLVVAPRRHPWRWVGVVVVLVLLAQLVNGLVTNPAWDWPTFA